MPSDDLLADCASRLRWRARVTSNPPSISQDQRRRSPRSLPWYLAMAIAGARNSAVRWLAPMRAGGRRGGRLARLAQRQGDHEAALEALGQVVDVRPPMTGVTVSASAPCNRTGRAGQASRSTPTSRPFMWRDNSKDRPDARQCRCSPPRRWAASQRGADLPAHAFHCARTRRSGRSDPGASRTLLVAATRAQDRSARVRHPLQAVPAQRPMVEPSAPRSATSAFRVQRVSAATDRDRGSYADNRL